MSDPRPEVPIFDIARHFDTVVTIGEAKVPIRVKRYTRGAWSEFKKKWDALMVTPRGAAELTEVEAEARNEQQLAFMEQTIVDAISLPEGYIRVNGEWVTTGDGLIDVFFARQDVLTDLMGAVLVQNMLVPMLRKNSNSPRDSATGSEVSVPTRGGDRQGPTATSAESSSSARAEGVAEIHESSAAAPSSSGATPGSEEPLIH